MCLKENACVLMSSSEIIRRKRDKFVVLELNSSVLWNVHLRNLAFLADALN